MIPLCPFIGLLFGCVFLVQGKPKAMKMLGGLVLFWGIIIIIGLMTMPFSGR